MSSREDKQGRKGFPRQPQYPRPPAGGARDTVFEMKKDTCRQTRERGWCHIHAASGNLLCAHGEWRRRRAPRKQKCSNSVDP